MPDTDQGRKERDDLDVQGLSRYGLEELKDKSNAPTYLDKERKQETYLNSAVASLFDVEDHD